MAMPATHADWTVDMLDELPDDGKRYEIIDGEVFVTPSPRYAHQFVVGELYARLRAYLKPTRLDRAHGFGLASRNDGRRAARGAGGVARRRNADAAGDRPRVVFSRSAGRVSLLTHHPGRGCSSAASIGNP